MRTGQRGVFGLVVPLVSPLVDGRPICKQIAVIVL